MATIKTVCSTAKETVVQKNLQAAAMQYNISLCYKTWSCNAETSSQNIPAM